MNPPHCDLVLSEVSIRASPNFDIHGVKFDSELTFADDLRGIVSRVSPKICISMLVRCIFMDTPVLLRFYYAISSQSSISVQ